MIYFLLIICMLIPQKFSQEIAGKKCKEYGEAVYVNEESPVLMRNARVNRVSQCGIVEVPLIIGGVKAGPKEFPHMALLGFGDSPNSEMTWECGASLISEEFILSAAHCFENRMRQSPQKVKLGMITLDSTQDLQEKNIIERHKHPEYEYVSKINDIALFKMDSPVQFTAYVRPACLNHENIASGSKFIATGFGKVDFYNTNGSNHLMKVNLQVFDKSVCESAFGVNQRFSKLKKGFKDSMICAGFTGGGKDTCQGDSGGPIQTVLTKPYCMYNIIGVTSFGIGCGMANTAAIYTRISSFLPWIESIVWK